jgi:hypothetical protein
MKYQDLSKENVVQVQCVPVSLWVTRVDQQPETEPDEEVSSRREQVQATMYLQAAMERGVAGDYTKAVRILDEGMTVLRSDAANSDLMAQFNRARLKMEERHWTVQDGAKLQDSCQAFMLQRCCTGSPSASGAQAEILLRYRTSS